MNRRTLIKGGIGSVGALAFTQLPVQAEDPFAEADAQLQQIEYWHRTTYVDAYGNRFDFDEIRQIGTIGFAWSIWPFDSTEDANEVYPPFTLNLSLTQEEVETLDLEDWRQFHMRNFLALCNQRRVDEAFWSYGNLPPQEEYERIEQEYIERFWIPYEKDRN